MRFDRFWQTSKRRNNFFLQEGQAFRKECGMYTHTHTHTRCHLPRIYYYAIAFIHCLGLYLRIIS